MIDKVESYIIECDNCKNIFENSSGYSIFADEEAAIQDAEEDGWLIDYKRNEHDGGCYCEKCHKIDEDTNELTLDKSLTKER